MLDRTACNAFGSRPSSCRIVGAIWVVSTGVAETWLPVTGPAPPALAADDERHVAVLRVVAAVLGDLPLLARVDGAVLRDADHVGHARVAERDADERGCVGSGVDLAASPELVNGFGFPLMSLPVPE